MDKYIGKVLADRYEILELIGIGGMAYVYKARDRAEDRIVAVKILKDEFLANEEFIRRFRNESRAIALLSHPNIVKIYDVLFGEFVQMIVMEYIDGITLKEYIEHQKVIRWKEAVHFTVQILRALQHAHDKGIVHRDIKPQNIMLLQDGTIKVMDFGIARFARTEPQTMTDKAIGSVHYISPEQARGERIDEKTDIYSVGVMLFEMLTGQLPFQGESPVSVALKQIQDVPKKPRDINPKIPEGLEYITLRAMQKDPANRYQSASEMLRDLDAFKRNPEIKFSTEMLVDEPTRHFSAVTPEEPDYEEPYEKRSAVVPVLTGIAFAFVVSALLFVIGIVWINNPFEVVADFDMPDLKGMTYEDAVAQYSNLNIVVTKRDYSDSYPKGQIYEQNPKANRSVKENTTVQVWVSEGTKIIPLPDFLNTDGELAEKSISDLGLVPIVTEQYDDQVTEGYVISQNPVADTELRLGDTVEIVVSLGKEDETTPVPDIRGISLSDARRVLEEYHLKLGEQTNVASDKPDGIIVGQSLDPETRVPAGTSIDVEISVQEKEDQKQLVIPIPLPSHNESYYLQITSEEEELSYEQIFPASNSGTHRVIVVGNGTKELTCLINGRLYLEIEVNFEDETFSIMRGEAGQFDF